MNVWNEADEEKYQTLLHFYEGLFAVSIHFYEGLFAVSLHFYEGLLGEVLKNIGCKLTIELSQDINVLLKCAKWGCGFLVVSNNCYTFALAIKNKGV